MIIVTGADSFVGKNFINATDHKCFCLVRKKENIKQKQAVVNFFDKKDISQYIKKGDVILHILGITAGDKKEIYRVNYLITKNLVDASKNKAKKIIFISSAITKLKEKGNYGKSKILAENYIKDSGIDYIFLKPSIIYGKENKMIGKLIKLIKKNKFIPVIGSGNYKIAPVYIKDINKILEKSINLDCGKEYFISGEEISMNNLIKKIAKIYSKKIIKIPIPLFLLKFISLFKIKIFPKFEQLNRITKHPKYDTRDFKKDFEIKLIGIDEGIKDLKKQGF